MSTIYLWIKTEGLRWFSNTEQVEDNLSHGEIQSLLEVPNRESIYVTFTLTAPEAYSCVHTWYDGDPGTLDQCPGFCLYLGNELDDFDKYVEWHVSGHHTARSLREEGGHDGAEAAADRRTRVITHALGRIHRHMPS